MPNGDFKVIEKDIFNLKHLTHAYIISSEDEEKRNEFAVKMASSYVCSDSNNAPCGMCRNCRKAKDNIHPDITWIDLANENGKIKKEITIGQVRGIIDDAYILPNEADKKVYIIKHADTMNKEAQNAVLKLLEEPPVFDGFILCVSNPEMLLPTVRSRCTLLNLNADHKLTEERKEQIQLADEFLKIVSKANKPAIFSWCSEHADMDSKNMKCFLDSVKEQLVNILTGRASLGIEKEQAIKLIELMDRCATYLSVNAAVKQLMGLIAVESVE